MNAVRITIATIFAIAAAAPLHAAEARKPIEIAALSRTSTVDFEKEILPMLKRNCLACHNQTKAEEKLVLETPQDILKGGDSGPAVVPGNPDKSLLLILSAHQKKPIMPPAGNKAGAVNLTPNELALIKLWIQQGAKGEVKGNLAIAWQPLPEGLNPIYSVALTQDGQYAACGRANQIFIYHVPSGDLVTRLTDEALIKEKLYAKPGVAHRDMAYSLAFSPDGTLLASGSYREIKLWRRAPGGQKAAVADAAKKSVQLIVASDDGKWLATADENAIKLWDVASAKPGKTLTGHTNAVTSLKFSPDSTKLLSGSTDKSAKIWSLADASVFAEIATPSEVNAVAWVSGGKQIATGGADNLIRLWKVPDAAKGALAAGKELKGHSKAVTALDAVAPEGAQLVSGSADGIVRIWTVDSAAAGKQITHGTPVTAVAVLPDGKVIASLGVTNTSVKLWTLADGKAAGEVKGDRVVLEKAAVAEREATFAGSEVAFHKAALKAAEDSLKKEQEAAKKAGEEKATLEKTIAEKRTALKKAMDEKAAADKASTDATAEVKKLTDAKEAADKAATQAETDAKAAKEKAAAAKDADKAPAEKASADAVAKQKTTADAKAAAEKALTDATTKQKEAADKLSKANKAFVDAEAEVKKYTNADEQLQLAEKSVKKVEASVASSKTSIASAEEAQKKADAASTAAKKSGTEAEKVIRAFAFSADSKTIATAGDDSIVRTWSADSGVPFENYSAHAGVVESVAFTKAGAIVTGGADRKVIFWDPVSSWKLERTIGSSVGESPLTGRVNALAFSRDGSRLASGSGEPSRSGELKLWNPADGKLAQEIKNAHSDAVMGVEFSANGKMIVSGAADKFVKVFSLADGKLIKAFEGHTHQVLGVSFKRDGRTVVSAGADNAVKVWSLETGEGKKTVAGFTKEATSIAFVGVTDQFLTTGGDSKVRIVSEAGSDVKTFSGATDFVYASAVKPDGRLVLAGGQDGVLRVWNGQSGALITAFNPPGKTN